MKKFTWLCVAVCLLALLCAGCAGETQEVTQQTGTTQDTTNLPGLEDSIFDDPTYEAYQPSLKVEQDTTAAEDPADDPTSEQTTTEDATAPSTSEGETLSYEAWMKLTPKEQRLYQESFASIEKFYVWYDAAKKAYEEANPPIEIEGGTIDLSTLPT